MYFFTGNPLRLAERTPSQVPRNADRKVRWPWKPRSTRFTRRLVAGSIFCAVLALCPAADLAQVTPPYIPPSPGQQTGPSPNRDPSMRKMVERMAKQRNTERQKKIVADTAKLLAMAQKLNDEVSHSTKNELSLAVVKQAAEIEKLAKSIKEKMRDGY